MHAPTPRGVPPVDGTWLVEGGAHGARGAPGWCWQRPSAVFSPSVSHAQALVLQCVLVAMYQFVQLDRHLQAIGQLGCSETLLHILMDYGPSFKVPLASRTAHHLGGACTRRAGARFAACVACLLARSPAPQTRPCMSLRVARLVARRYLVPSCWSFSCSSETFSRMCYSTTASR